MTYVNKSIALFAIEVYDVVITTNICVNRIERDVGKYVGLDTSQLEGDVMGVNP
jgi:hypothetical protein